MEKGDGFHLTGGVRVRVSSDKRDIERREREEVRQLLWFLFVCFIS